MDSLRKWHTLLSTRGCTVNCSRVSLRSEFSSGSIWGTSICGEIMPTKHALRVFSTRHSQLAVFQAGPTGLALGFSEPPTDVPASAKDGIPGVCWPLSPMLLPTHHVLRKNRGHRFLFRRMEKIPSWDLRGIWRPRGCWTPPGSFWSFWCPFWVNPLPGPGPGLAAEPLPLQRHAGGLCQEEPRRAETGCAPNGGGGGAPKMGAFSVRPFFFFGVGGALFGVGLGEAKDKPPLPLLAHFENGCCWKFQTLRHMSRAVVQPIVIHSPWFSQCVSIIGVFALCGTLVEPLLAPLLFFPPIAASSPNICCFHEPRAQTCTRHGACHATRRLLA